MGWCGFQCGLADVKKNLSSSYYLQVSREWEKYLLNEYWLKWNCSLGLFPHAVLYSPRSILWLPPRLVGLLSLNWLTQLMYFVYERVTELSVSNRVTNCIFIYSSLYCTMWLRPCKIERIGCFNLVGEVKKGKWWIVIHSSCYFWDWICQL